MSSTNLPSFLPPDPKVQEPYRVTPQMAIRIAILGVVAVVLFCALFFRLWALQVISGERYLEDAKNNQVRTFRIEAPRGTVVDRNGEMLVGNQAGTQVRLWPAALQELPKERRQAQLRRLSELLTVPMKELNRALARGAADLLTPVTIKTSVKDLKVNYLLEHQRDFPGVQIDEAQLRRYDHRSLAAQTLGYVGEISAEQLEAKEKDGYAGGDRIGQAGIEASYDRYLRGQPGVGQVRVDALGRITSGQEFSQLPEPGYSVRLTLDVDLQRAAEDALSYGIRVAKSDPENWAANGGAIVAMDPRNGEILALASNPTYDARVFSDPSQQELDRLAAPEANSPTLGRAAAGLYPPGSTFKPVTALAALQERMLTPDEPIQCSPGMTIDGQRFVNWDPYYNETITLVPALAMSCDTYFYDVALRFYQRKDSPLQAWARKMGFGAPTGLGVGLEGGGLIPTPAWRQRTFESEIDKLWTSGDSVQLAIGQGDVLVTPLQMTRFYALIANGGKLVDPHLVKSIEEPKADGQASVIVRPLHPKPPRDIGLDPLAVRVVQEGLFDATHVAFGTSSSTFAAFPYDIAGKTGTAEKFRKVPGIPEGRLFDQSWWCGYGPYERPELVVCALIENGGHGGTAAAPAALQVFAKYFGVDPGSFVSSTRETD